MHGTEVSEWIGFAPQKTCIIIPGLPDFYHLFKSRDPYDAGYSGCPEGLSASKTFSDGNHLESKEGICFIKKLLPEGLALPGEKETC